MVWDSLGLSKAISMESSRTMDTSSRQSSEWKAKSVENATRSLSTITSALRKTLANSHNPHTMQSVCYRITWTTKSEAFTALIGKSWSLTWRSGAQQATTTFSSLSWSFHLATTFTRTLAGQETPSRVSALMTEINSRNTWVLWKPWFTWASSILSPLSMAEIR